jgi:hypothetical protein
MLPVHEQRGKMLKYTGAQEGGQQILGNRRFDGVAVNQAKRVMYTFEFKRTLDREHGYVLRCGERATEQYASLLQIVRGFVTSKGWKVQSVNFIAGTKSMYQPGSME